MEKVLLYFLLSLTCFNLQAQDYSAYYTLIEKAKVARISSDLQLADSLYTIAFQNVLGFSQDYSDAFKNRYRLSSKIDESLYIKTISTGTSWMDLKYDLKNMGVSNFKTYKKTFRKNKLRNKTNGSPLFRLLIRDQLSRSKNLRFLVRKNADSINTIKLEKLFVKKPDLFDRNKTGWLTVEILKVLLIHQDNWKNTENLFYRVRENVAQGKTDPSVIQIMIERPALFEGILFKTDTLTGKLNASKSNYKLSCGYYHFSAIHGFYGRSYDEETRKTILLPSSPDNTISEINELRKYLFLLDVKQAFPEEKFSILSEEAYCEKFNKINE